MVQLVVSVVLYFVIFFGIAFILNMLLRKTWLMACLFPIVMIFIIDNVSFISYFTSPGESFSALGDRIVGLTIADILILLSGFLGTIVSGFVIRFLRKSGYQMF
ncbi:YuiB family protein [Oceanobacillus sojae]|uniref:YuiB family protein n=1 Tax=Oceanobacillus sojae TaxID=582851 RepID=UPI0009886680|nr:YuiB family protein [Oceanobacillus sojae]MCT1904546.1 YuiB family protein [Oceanobacillus sojae]